VNLPGGFDRHPDPRDAAGKVAFDLEIP